MPIENILGLTDLNPREVLNYSRAIFGVINNRSQYLGPTLFPGRNVSKLNWEYIVGSNKSPVPVMAGIKTINAESRVAKRKKKLTKVSGEIPQIARKIAVDPDTLVMLDSALNNPSGNEAYVAALRDIYNDAEAMTAQVAARIEWIRMNALAQGSFTYNEDDVTFNVDFGIDANLQLSFGDALFTTQVAWTDKTNSNPIEQLLEAIEQYRTITGTVPGRILGSSKAVRLAQGNKNLPKQMFGVDKAEQFIVPAQFSAFLAQQEIPAIATYDVQVATEDAVGVETAQRLTPENRLIFLPPSNAVLGETLFGPTQEEVLSNLGLSSDARQTPDPTVPRLWSQVYVEGSDPGTLWTKAIASSFVTFPGADLVMYLDVY